MERHAYSKRTIWGLAKSAELALTDEELHLLIEAHTGKSSMKELTEYEIRQMVGVLARLKSSSTAAPAPRGSQDRGNTGTRRQRAKLYKLAQELGWDSPKRLNGFVRRMFGVSSVEWLDYEQCSKVIEALKKMIQREEEKKNADAGTKGKEATEGVQPVLQH